LCLYFPLSLSDARIRAMADVLAAIAALPDPILRIKAERSVAAIAQTLDLFG